MKVNESKDNQQETISSDFLLKRRVPGQGLNIDIIDPHLKKVDPLSMFGSPENGKSGITSSNNLQKTQPSTSPELKNHYVNGNLYSKIVVVPNEEIVPNQQEQKKKQNNTFNSSSYSIENEDNHNINTTTNELISNTNIPVNNLQQQVNQNASDTNEIALKQHNIKSIFLKDKEAQEKGNGENIQVKEEDKKVKAFEIQNEIITQPIFIGKLGDNSDSIIKYPPKEIQRNNKITNQQRRASQFQPINPPFQRKIRASFLEQIRENNNPAPQLEELKIDGNVEKTLLKIQENQVNRIISTEQLDNEMKTIKLMRQSSKLLDHAESNQNPQQVKYELVDLALKQVRMVEILVELAERGSEKDLVDIMHILQNDPKKYIRSTDDPQHILNKLNSKCQNVSYVACKNGNLRIIEFLHKQEANFGIKSKVGGTIEEYPLQVAVRWNHLEVVRFLLSSKVVSISQDQIKLAYKEAKTKELKQLFTKYIPKKPFFICC